MITIVDFGKNGHKTLYSKETLDKDRSMTENCPVAGFILVGTPVLSSMMLSYSRIFSIDFPLWSVFSEPNMGCNY